MGEYFDGAGLSPKACKIQTTFPFPKIYMFHHLHQHMTHPDTTPILDMNEIPYDLIQPRGIVWFSPLPKENWEHYLHFLIIGSFHKVPFHWMLLYYIKHMNGQCVWESPAITMHMIYVNFHFYPIFDSTRDKHQKKKCTKDPTGTILLVNL